MKAPGTSVASYPLTRGSTSVLAWNWLRSDVTRVDWHLTNNSLVYNNQSTVIHSYINSSTHVLVWTNEFVIYCIIASTNQRKNIYHQRLSEKATIFHHRCPDCISEEGRHVWRVFCVWKHFHFVSVDMRS